MVGMCLSRLLFSIRRESLHPQAGDEDQRIALGVHRDLQVPRAIEASHATARFAWLRINKEEFLDISGLERELKGLVALNLSWMSSLIVQE